MTQTFFSTNWCGLTWTNWQPLDQLMVISRQISDIPGVYRIRPQGGFQLVYIGQTRMGLRSRLRMLYHCYDEKMPYNDPHTAAPCLWAWRIETGMQFEFSVASFSGSDQERQVLEDMLLWQHRVEYGESTLGNHGRFHPLYSRPSNRKLGRPGQKLLPGLINPASGPSMPPLSLHGQPQDDDWMSLSWSALEPLYLLKLKFIPTGNGLYKILDADTNSLLYIGESHQLSKRLKTHSAKSWKPYQPLVSFYVLPDEILPHQRHELETDLIGAYYAAFKQPPVFQYLNH